MVFPKRYVMFYIRDKNTKNKEKKNHSSRIIIYFQSHTWVYMYILRKLLMKWKLSRNAKKRENFSKDLHPPLGKSPKEIHLALIIWSYLQYELKRLIFIGELGAYHLLHSGRCCFLWLNFLFCLFWIKTILGRGRVDLLFSWADLCFFGYFYVGAKFSLFVVLYNFAWIKIVYIFGLWIWSVF